MVQLSERYKVRNERILISRLRDGLTYKEIATREGTSVATVRSVLARSGAIHLSGEERARKLRNLGVILNHYSFALRTDDAKRQLADQKAYEFTAALEWYLQTLDPEGAALRQYSLSMAHEHARSLLRVIRLLMTGEIEVAEFRRYCEQRGVRFSREIPRFPGEGQ